jgi:hypothetical protein
MAAAASGDVKERSRVHMIPTDGTVVELAQLTRKSWPVRPFSAALIHDDDADGASH